MTLGRKGVSRNSTRRYLITYDEVENEKGSEKASCNGRAMYYSISYIS